MADDVEKDGLEEKDRVEGGAAGGKAGEGSAEEDAKPVGKAEGAGGGDGGGDSEVAEETKNAEDETSPAPDAANGSANDAAPEGGAEESAEEDSVVDDDVWAAALKEAGAAGTDGEVAEGTEGAGGEGGEAVGEAAGGGENAGAAVQRVDARPADFAELNGNASGAIANMDMILDIPVTLAVELGRAEMIIKDILQLGQGSVVELEKIAGEPMEILVNGRLVARGEVVMVEEKFGVRLTDIISPTERVKRLG